LQALEIFLTFEDTYTAGVVLRNLARLWRNSGDADLPDQVAEKLGMTRDEAEKLLREMLGEGKSNEEK